MRKHWITLIVILLVGVTSLGASPWASRMAAEHFLPILSSLVDGAESPG